MACKCCDPDQHMCRRHSDPQWQAEYLAGCLPTGYLILAEDEALVGDQVRRWLPRELAKQHRCLVRVPAGWRIEGVVQAWLSGREPWLPRAAQTQGAA